jgi:trimeric autotransporter adhesin
MKIKITSFLLVLMCFVTKAQTPSSKDSLVGFDEKELLHHLERFKGTEETKQLYIARVKKEYIRRKYNIVTPPKPQEQLLNKSGNNQSPLVACTNIDFEQGNTSGWTITGSNAITSGTGLDPFGNFPVVYPGGNYSLQLSDNNLSTTSFTSTATRVISVTPGNTFFNLHFALDILNFPHDSLSSAKFSIQFFNSSGVVVPCPQFQCTYYVDALGNPHSVGISGFQQTWGNGSGFPTTGPGVNLGGQNYPVTYAGWQTVGLDLTSYVGTNVTCVVTCQWCLYQYDWAYCYIDADCPTTNVPPLGQCLTLPASLCGPPGMTTYAWTAPPGNSVPTSATTCINASTAGVFTLNCSVSTSTCPATAYTYTYGVGPGPTASFTNTTASCAGAVTFNSTSSTGGSPITSYTWNWGDGTTNGTTNPATHNYVATGNQTVTLVVSNGNCVDSIQHVVNIPPHPVVNFTTTNNCLGTASGFTSTSSSSTGITSQNWNFGDGSTGSGGTPTHTYATAGTYTVTLVASDASCTDSIKLPITINPSPAVVVNSPSACNGGTATVTATGASTYTWSPATGLSATTGSTVTANPPSTQTYVVSGTDANGCIGVATSTVLVVANPAVIVNSPSICTGFSATLTATGAATYTWSPAGGLSATTGSVVTANPAVTTVYTINGAVGTCTAVGQCTVTVNSSPTVTVNTGTICINQQTATLNAGGASTYVWTPATALSTTSGPTTNANPNVTTTYTVIGTDANGCTSSKTTTVTVLPLPVVTATGDTTCINTTIYLKANGGVAYSWSGPNGYSSNQQNPSIPGAALNMSGPYAVTVTDNKGCINGGVAMVQINPLPVIGASCNTPCVGSALNLTSSSAVSWAWTGPNGFSSPLQNPTISGVGSALAGVYTVNAKDINGCIGTGTTTVTINPLPVLAITPAVSSGCAPLCVTFSNTTSATGTYNWNFADGNNSATVNPTHCYTGQGSLLPTLTLTDANGCTGSTTASVLVFPQPIADFFGTPQPTTELDSYIHFYDVSSGATIAQWHWTLGDDSNTVSTSNNPQIQYPDPGSYNVHMVVTSDHGCKDSTDKVIVIAEDYELFVPNAFSPNADGTNDFFFAKGNGIKDFKMYIFDRWGTQIFNTEDITKGWDGRINNKGDIVMEDVYVWKVELHTNKGDKKMVRGVVSVIK